MALTQALVQSFIKVYPRITKLAHKLQANHNLIANYPLLLKQTSSKGQAIISQQKIRKGNDILLLSGEQCVFSTGLSGSSPSQQKQINEHMQNLSAQYDSMNQDYMSRMKIYLQLLANSQVTKSMHMPLRQYAEYVMNEQSTGISKADINSRFLFELYQSWEIGNKITFGFLKKQFLKRVEEQQFLKACSKGKNIIRSAGNTSFKFAAPFLDKLYHSFTPNCQFDVVFFPHRKAPFVRIKTLRDIQPGEKATISYGQLNNYELLLRYGFTIKDNPLSVFMLPLNFENILEIFNKNIDWKQAQFLKHKLKLKSYVKILPSGQIDGEDLKMMRILINDSDKPSDKDLQSSKMDQLIHRFICDHAKSLRKNIKINNLKVTNNKQIKQLEEQQISILQNFISKNSK